MRLLTLDGVDGVRLTRNFNDDETPPYAILSHTWGADDEEVTYDDLQNSTCSSKPGMAKIVFCGEQAKKDGLDHFWVDSCCIDKRSSTELSEAIISMFRWYKKSRKCYVYLTDVSTLKRDHDGSAQPWEAAFRSSRWFTRGWTLQELLAPTIVEFYSRDRSLVGDKKSLDGVIQSITGIPLRAIRGAALSEFTPQERLSWASRRSTKKHEDKYYCLQGIFDLFLAPQYGEGDHAAVRLQEAIAKRWSQLDLRLLDNPSAQTSSAPVKSLSEEERLAHRQGHLESLAFEQMDVRRSTIKNAQTTTCEWLLEHPTYLEWHSVESRPKGREILWLSGKPGAGKSTLVKYALAQAQKEKKPGDLITHFFFNARGDQMEKTTLGMYRALVLQLFQQASDLQDLLDTVPPRAEWTLLRLQELFSAAVPKLGHRRLSCFVDALDECDEEEIRDMVHYFEDLGNDLPAQTNPLSVLFASRHYPTIEIRDGWRLKLEDEVGHGEDLGKYIKRHLRAAKGKSGDSLRGAVQQKANGVFMWAVLVVDILNKEWDRGRKFAMKQRLAEIPPELSDLFKQILRRDQVNMDDLLLCLQWILFAKRPLTRDEFYFAMTAGLVPAEHLSEEWNAEIWDPSGIGADEMTRFVYNSSKGLAELTKSKKSPTVQFIHESVRDFLIKDGGLCDLWPDLIAGTDISSLSHEKLKTCCQTYLKQALNLMAIEPPLDHRSRGCSRYPADSVLKQRRDAPFADYATQNLFYHSDKAAVGLPQDQFLRELDLSAWKDISRRLEKHEVRRIWPRTSLAYILAEKDCGLLVKGQGLSGLGHHERHGRFGFPLLAAFTNGSAHAIRALLSDFEANAVEAVFHDPGFGKIAELSTFDTPFTWSIKNENWSLAKLLIQLKLPQPRPGSWARFEAGTMSQPMSHCPQDLLESLVIVGCLDNTSAIFPGLDRGSPHGVHEAEKFCNAVMGRVRAIGLREVADDLVMRRRELSSSTHLIHDRKFLEFACEAGSHELVTVLLDLRRTRAPGTTEKSVAANNRLCSDITIRSAVVGGSESVLRLVVNNGASSLCAVRDPGLLNVDTVHPALLEARRCGRDTEKNSFLPLAAEMGDSNIVHVLLERGADVNSVSSDTGRTALGQACIDGNYSVVELLLKHGAGVDVVAVEWSTPLHLACGGPQPSFAIVESLLRHGSDINCLDRAGNNVLHLAVKAGHAAVLIALLEHSVPTHPLSSLSEPSQRASTCSTLHIVDPEKRTIRHAILDVVNHKGDTPLLVALKSDLFQKEDIARVLLDYGASPDTPDSNGNTPLLLVCRSGRPGLARLLLQHGACPNCIDAWGNTPLVASPSFAPDLLEFGADVNSANHAGDTALLVACRTEGLLAVKVLLQHGANPNVANQKGFTPFITAMISMHMDLLTMQVLLEYGATAGIRSRTPSGENALHVAARKGSPEVVGLLINAGVDVNSVNSVGETALHVACRHQVATAAVARIGRLLLEHGASLGLSDFSGNTPLDLAICFSCPRVVPDVMDGDLLEAVRRFGDSALHLIARYWNPWDATFDLIQLLVTHATKVTPAVGPQAMALEEALMWEDPAVKRIISAFQTWTRDTESERLRAYLSIVKYVPSALD